MQIFARALAALIMAMIAISPALAADPVSKSGAWTADAAPTKRSWTGVYIGGGAGMEIVTLEGDDSGFKVGDDAAAGYVRLGYRQEIGGRFVIGAFIEGGASAMDVADEIKATYAALGGGEVGFLLGRNVLLSLQGGLKRTWLDAGEVELQPDGYWAGVNATIDTGEGFDVDLGYRKDFLEDDKGGLSLDSSTGFGYVGVSVRF